MGRSKQHETIDITQNASMGTAMLKKRRQMTMRQAHFYGKLGRADLHMHSAYSDGIGTIEEILQHTQRNTNLAVIAITDHDVIEGSLTIVTSRRPSSDGVTRPVTRLVECANSVATVREAMSQALPRNPSVMK